MHLTGPDFPLYLCKQTSLWLPKCVYDHFLYRDWKKGYSILVNFVISPLRVPIIGNPLSDYQSLCESNCSHETLSPPHRDNENWQRALASHSVMGSSDKQALMADGGGQSRMSSVDILKPQAKEISSCLHNAPTECIRCKWENIPQRYKHNDQKLRLWILWCLTALCITCGGSVLCIMCICACVCLPGKGVITLGVLIALGLENEGNKAYE